MTMSSYLLNVLHDIFHSGICWKISMNEHRGSVSLSLCSHLRPQFRVTVQIVKLQQTFLTGLKFLLFQCSVVLTAGVTLHYHMRCSNLCHFMPNPPDFAAACPRHPPPLCHIKPASLANCKRSLLSIAHRRLYYIQLLNEQYILL